MAAMPPLTLPVSLTVGDHTVEAGEITLEPGDQLRPVLAEFFREVVAKIETSTDEGGDDGTP